MRNLLMGLSLLLLFACDNQTKNLALGTLERDRIALTATTNEVVVALPVKQGAQVKKGTVLVKLDDVLQKAKVAKAEADKAQATANFDKLKKGARNEDIASARAELYGAKAKLIESEASYKRAKNLTERKLTSQASLDQALASRDSDLAHQKSAQEQLQVLIKGTREEDLRKAEAHLAAAVAVLVGEQKKLADLTIKATRNGILDNLPWNLGERVTMGSPLAVLLAGDAPYARVYIPEPYRVKIKEGDKLVVHVDGVEHSLMGTVRWVSNEPAFTPYYALNQQERARLMYLAEIQLPLSEASLPNGLPAQVELP